MVDWHFLHWIKQCKENSLKQSVLVITVLYHERRIGLTRLSIYAVYILPIFGNDWDNEIS